jgi:hypothetical protein
MSSGFAFIELIASAVVGGGVVSGIISMIFKSFLAKIEAEIRSKKSWKEEAVSDLLGPLNMQFDRTSRAFKRWRTKNLFLEVKVVKVGNEVIRDLLLDKGHLIPPDLLDDAGKLVEHYDVWLEKFEEQRSIENPNHEAEFLFVGPDGFPFPTASENRFKNKFKEYWHDLYEVSNK